VEIGILSAFLVWHYRCNTHNIHDCFHWVGDARPCHRAVESL